MSRDSIRIRSYNILSVVLSMMFALTILASCGSSSTTTATPTPTANSSNSASGIQKIKHVIVIMQENRSFDSYFGTYPGADGIPMQNGQPTVCVPDPTTGGCTRPYHDAADINGGGPHAHVDAEADIDGGRMDGF